MPELGETADEGVLLEWHVAEGDTVELGQVIFTVETDKASVEVESVEEGVVLQIRVPAGETVNTGTVLAYVGEAGEAIPKTQ
jgi:pyruvate/2-oxoglutarate dehydrogenase complex dihydrolipoamide acyltransferase (E2) component